MSSKDIERRRDPRTQAFLPIAVRSDGASEDMSAHLLDLSTGGAAVLTTAYDAPALGQYVDLCFEMPPNDEDGEERVSRRETGMVVNIRQPERGVTRLGIRFIQHRGVNSDLFDPLDTLSSHRKFERPDTHQDRWGTARNFDQLNLTASAAN